LEPAAQKAIEKRTGHRFETEGGAKAFASFEQKFSAAAKSKAGISKIGAEIKTEESKQKAFDELAAQRKANAQKIQAAQQTGDVKALRQSLEARAKIIQKALKDKTFTSAFVRDKLGFGAGPTESELMSELAEVLKALETIAGEGEGEGTAEPQLSERAAALRRRARGETTPGGPRQ
jgi:hypothetical protein